MAVSIPGGGTRLSTAKPQVSEEVLLLRKIHSLLVRASTDGLFEEPGTRILVTQVPLSDTVRFSLGGEIGDDVLRFTITNPASIVGTTGVLFYSFTPEPGGPGNRDSFNELALGSRQTFIAKGQRVYLRPSTSGQVAVIETVSR